MVVVNVVYLDAAVYLVGGPVAGDALLEEGVLEATACGKLDF